MMDQTETERKAKNKKTERVIGALLVIALAYLILSNISIEWPLAGFAVKDSEKNCIETEGPGVLTETRQEQLTIEDTGFKVMLNERKAVVSIRNKDEVTGTVRVIVYCVNGDEQGEQRKSIAPGETAVFNFLDVEDCDLDYYVDPQMVTRTINRTSEVHKSDCR